MSLAVEPDCTRSRNFWPTGSFRKRSRTSVRSSDSAGLPSIASILSPTLIPAWSAGLPEITSMTLKPALAASWPSQTPTRSKLECTP
jgi:hypothetical protein